MQKTAIVYGDIKDSIQKKALLNLSEILLDYAGCHPACFSTDESFCTDGYIVFYLGTKENNRYIKEKSNESLTHSEEYAIAVGDNTVIIEGSDSLGVLYGVSDFLNKYIPRVLSCDGSITGNPFDKGRLPDCRISEYPKIKNRGLWTWGFVIYDYKGYIDNMVKLKFNSLVIWNDYAPLNANEIVDYAHSCGVKIIWGMQWLWETDCSKFDLSNLDSFPKEIFDRYERDYAETKGDGVYFQTFTELDVDNIGGVLIAKAAADFVNKTAEFFFNKYPDLELQFGLHSDSVKNKTEFIKTVNPKIRIVWENCGSFPYFNTANEIGGFEDTVDFTEKMAVLRGENDRFGFVAKGIVKLDWTRFTHLTGPHFIGIGSKDKKLKKLSEKPYTRKFAQSFWLKNAEKARIAFSTLEKLKKGDFYALALVEDSMFEDKIFFAPVLFSELIWNPDCDTESIITEISLREYVEFE